MKIGKIHTKSRVIQVLLGMAVAGVLLLTSCQNIFDMADQKPKGNGDGYGFVKVDLDLGEARTLRPDLGQIAYFTYEFTGVDVTNVVSISYASNTPNPEAFRLPEGKYTILVKAFTGNGPYNLVAVGVYGVGNGEFDITVSEPTKISVVLTPKVSAPGTLTISIKLPANNPSATPPDDNTTVVLSGGSYGFTYEIKQLMAAGALSVPTDITLTTANGSPAPGTAGGSVIYSRGTVGTGTSTPAGTYLITGRINTNNAKYGGFSEVIHVYENMYTEFVKDYTVTDTLASVTSAQEAYDILKDEITTWIKNTGANTGKDPLTASDGKDLTTAGTIRLNYVKSRTDLSGSPAVNFPIVLQGGWQPDTTGFPAASSWNVGDSSAVTTVNLINTSVKANGNLSAAPTYIVELWPVAEYTLSFGTTVTNKAGRKVTVADVGGAGSKGSIVLDEQHPIMSGIGLVGATDITIEKAAITISVDGAKAAFAQPNATTGVYNFPNGAESRTYVINVYETVDEQAESAFKRLKDEIATVWVEQKAALTRSAAPDFTASTNTNFPAYYGGADTVTLSYVVTRLNASTPQAVAGNTFYIDVPNSVANVNYDDRWETSGLWTTTVGAGAVTNETTAATANAGDSKTIYYRPYGGDRIPYYVRWVPVAEFYVSYVEKDVEVFTQPPVYPGTSSVIIKDDASSGGTNVTYKVDDNTGPFGDYDVYKGKKYKLGKTVIAQTDVTITIDYTSEAADGVDATPPNPSKFDFFTTTNGPVAVDDPQTTVTNADIIQNNTTGKDVLATSREYHVKVYRTIAKQILDAQEELRRESDPLKWFTDTNDFTNPSSPTIRTKYHPDGLKATSTATEIQSNLTFVGSEPTFGIRNDYVAPVYDTDGVTIITPAKGANFLAKGWSAAPVTVQASIPADTTTGTKTLLLKFTPKGALELATITGPAYTNQDGVYKIKLQPALLYKVNYQKFPIGNDPVTGTVTVAGAEPGTSTDITPARPAYNGSSAAEEFIGVGKAITINATSTPADKVNVVKNRADSTPSGTSNAAGLLTITAPADYAAMTAAANVNPINIDVYPSVVDQQNNFLSNMRRVSRTSLIDWTPAASQPSGIEPLNLATSIKDNLPAGASTQPTTVNETAFQVVATLAGTAGNGLQIGKPGNNYYFEAANATSVGYGTLVFANEADVLKIANGNKNVTITFNPNGTTGTSNNDPKVYTFKLTAVAQYNIVMMHGPTGASTYGVDLQIKTYYPGTDGTGTPAGTGPAVPDADNYTIDFNQGTPVTTYYGSIGTFADAPATNRGPPVITSSSLNIFSTDVGTKGTFVVVNGNTLTQNSAITSRIYTIRVYPTLADQIAQVRTKLNNLAGTSASGWVTNKATTGSSAARGVNLIGPVTTATTAGPGNFRAGSNTGDTNTLEFQFWGDTPIIAPPTTSGVSTIITPNDTNTANNASSGYSVYAITLGTAGEGVAPSYVGTRKLTFTGYGGSSSDFFTIRYIPMVKYNVNYANGASGSVSIRLPNVADPTTEDTVLFNAVGANPPTQTGYIRRGQTTIGISTTKGSYNEIQVRQLQQISGDLLSSKSKNEPATGGPNDFTAFNYDADNEWEILVIK